MQIKQKIYEKLIVKYPPTFVKKFIEQLDINNMLYYLNKELKNNFDIKDLENLIKAKIDNIYEQMWKDGKF